MSDGSAVLGGAADVSLHDRRRLVDLVLAGGGDMGELMRRHDWSTSLVGPVEAWPQSLRTALSILLASGYPMLVVWGPDFVQFYNDAYRPVLGATKHPAALGQSSRECWPEIWDYLGEMFSRVLGGEEIGARDQLFVLDRNGYVEETYFDFSYSPIRDETGGIGGVFVTCMETTKRVLGERRMATLRELAARTAASERAEDACRVSAAVLGENTADVPFALLYLARADRQGLVLAGTVGLEHGDAVCRDSIRRGEGTPWPVFEALDRSESIVVEELSEELGALPSPWPELPRQAVLLPIAGSELGAAAAGVLVAGVSARLALDDEYRGFLSLAAGQVATAVARARSFQEAQERAAALAELDRVKTAFFSNVSHEFRTPLALILAPAEEALRDGDADLPEVHRHRLEVIRRNAIRLRRLVDDVLDFSRLESGRLVARPRPTDLATLTRELALSFAPALEASGLELDLAMDSRVPCVMVDREMWEKVVLNLLSNALKYTLSGRITVSLRYLGGRTELAVSDTGIGIAQDELPRLFERFHRVRGAGGRSHEGSGIGLALVRELVALHGGEVSVQSELGAGSTFTVLIPLAPAEAEAGPDDGSDEDAEMIQGFLEEAKLWLADGVEPPAAVPESRSARTVLVVDDNADMRSMLAEILGRDSTVLVAKDGAEGLALAREKRPDLVLSDVMMPNLDGFGLLRELRAHPATAEIPVIFLSARAGDEASVEGFEAGVHDYLVKPFSPLELLARVNSQLERTSLRENEREARRRAELLAENAERLAAALDVGAVSSAAVASLESLGVSPVAVGVSRGGGIEISAASGLLADTAERYKLQKLDASLPMPEAVRNASVVSVASDAEFAERYPQAADGWRRYGLESIVVFPLLDSGRNVIGALMAASGQPAWLDDDRHALLAALADQTGLALERALLEEDRVAAEARAQMLSRLAESMERRISVGERAEAAVQLLVGDFADSATIDLIEGDSAPAAAQTPQGLASAGVALRTLATASARSERDRGATSELSLPLRARGRTIGFLTVAHGGSGAAPDPQEGAHASALASRIALLLDNALLYEREREASHTLQLGLLGGGKPVSARSIELAPAYQAGTATLEVGGDWYDAFTISEDCLAIVVGDVVGHGLEAAVAMGQLRGAVRALATREDPTRLLNGLDVFVEGTAAAAMATLVYVELNVSSGELRYCCAGHPPPLVVSADGTTRYLWEGRSAPLGASFGAGRSHAAATLAAGDTLVLYTDGLVERRGEDLRDGLARLEQAALCSSVASVEDTRDALVAAMVGADPPADDVCLIVARYRPVTAGFNHTIPAEPEALAELRHALRAWLSEVGVSGEEQYEALLAAGEAAANSVEHAYPGDERGLVEIEGRLFENGPLELLVRDRGVWHDRVPEPHRGRGRAIMETLMDDVAIQHGDNGTTVRLCKRPKESAAR